MRESNLRALDYYSTYSGNLVWWLTPLRALQFYISVCVKSALLRDTRSKWGFNCKQIGGWMDKDKWILYLARDWLGEAVFHTNQWMISETRCLRLSGCKYIIESWLNPWGRVPRTGKCLFRHGATVWSTVWGNVAMAHLRDFLSVLHRGSNTMGCPIQSHLALHHSTDTIAAMQSDYVQWCILAQWG